MGRACNRGYLSKGATRIDVNVYDRSGKVVYADSTGRQAPGITPGGFEKIQSEHVTRW